MKKLTPLAGLFLLFHLSPAQNARAEDLTLPNERWLAEFSRYLCTEGGTPVEAPLSLREQNFRLTRLTTDSSLDNVLLKAEFQEQGATCSYSALLLADNALNTVRLLDSRAHAPLDPAAPCAEGKALLDQALAQTEYWYFGRRPHSIALVALLPDTESVCPGQTGVGITYDVRGRLSP
jgi:hypothetical protein